MKKIVLLFVLVLFTVHIFCLNANATYIKKTYPNKYETTIKMHALMKWKDDYSMIIYEIDNQSNALIELISIFKSENTRIVLNAIKKWSFEEYKERNILIINQLKTFSIEGLMSLHCDWVMVLYEYNLQVQAKSDL